jgi:hypothetical protein
MHKEKIEERHLVDAHVHSWSEAIREPWKATNARIPLSDKPNAPCKTETFSITGQSELRIPSGSTAIDLYPVFDGVFNQEGAETDPYMGSYTKALTPHPCPIGTIGAGVRSVCMVGQYSADVDTSNSFKIPVWSTNTFTVEADNYDAVMPIQGGADHRNSADQARLVSLGIRFSMLNTQSTIEGRVQSVCLFEMPLDAAQFSDYRQDRSYKNSIFGANRNQSVEWWPNCETPQFRPCLINSSVEGKSVRQRIKLSNLQEGDQILVTFKANYEIVRPRASQMAAPSPLTASGAQLGNAMMTFSGNKGTLASHLIAHKIVSHPHFSKVRHLADTALEMIGGSAVASKMFSYLKTALAEVPAVVEAAAPLLV